VPSTIENVDLLDEMAAQIRDAVDDVTDVDVQVEPRMVLSQSPPTIDMWPGDTARDQPSAAFNDDGGYLFTVRARVSTADHTAGQDLLLAFMDEVNPLSIGQALYDDPTLGGLASDLSITNQTGYLLAPDSGGEGVLLACQWTVLVLPSRS
jgi:hypothetical protein